MNHVIYFGDHPRPGVFKIDVQPGLTLYFDAQGCTHTLVSNEPIGTKQLIAALAAIKTNARKAA